MSWNIDILKAEGDILKKIHAFGLFKNQGIAIIERNFPRLIDFILANAHKSFEDFEKEQLAILEKFSEVA
ncbi:MAG: hypothetical protein K2X37_11455 [Chitinophagaceae bacterium]|nr:hypothetical protein [Chitinophagaceae bacterium]